MIAKSDNKPVILRVKFGKGRNAKIKEWRFKRVICAEICGEILFKCNPKCTTYMVMK